ncbi:MAG: ATP-binding protein [Desulforhopalus sp.]|nr:ATP-binding protein [Desulforhopalus sp.]
MVQAKQREALLKSSPDKSLSRRFGLTLVSVVAVILVVFSVVVGWYNYARKEAELHRQLGQAMKLAETSLPEAVWKLDDRSINDILRAILANDAVVFARVLVDDQVVAEQMKRDLPVKGPADFQDMAAYLVSGAPIHREGHSVGVLQLVMSKAEIYKDLFASTLSVIGLLFLLIIAILSTSLAILRHSVFRPLAILEKSAQQIADGHLETRIDIDTNDEIGKLATNLRIMTRRLQENFEQLEQKVRDRTADLSQAKLAAEETSRHLAVTGAELQALLDNSPVGILFLDSNGTIKRANLELAKITGYSFAELVGNTGRILYATTEAYNTMMAKVRPQLLRNGYYEKQAALQRKDGTEIICQLHGRVVPNDKGIEGVVWSVEDITQRVRMENELLKTKKQESISVLAGGIAHDFNNILFAVLGNLSLAERLAEPGGPMHEHILAAQKASIRAKELTAKLLNFARGAEPVKATVSLPEMIRDITGLVLAGRKSKVQCRLEIPEDLWGVSMDKEQIGQVIVSLVQNADQAMPEGGTITIGLANRELVADQIAGLTPGKYVQISLSDEGQGIEAPYLDKIFDPYFSTREKDSNKGSGLGLAIVHSIITRHEGKITVDSVPGRGTTFTLYLPVLAIDQKPQLEKSVILPTGKGTVLVIDRDGEGGGEAGDMLQHMGYTTRLVHEGKAAVELYRAAMAAGRPFVAVLLDLAIPGEGGGLATMADLLQVDPKVKVIAASDAAEAAVTQDFARYGFLHAVTKPYQLLELNRALAVANGR